MQSAGDKELWSEVLRVQHKVFYVDLKENPRGRYLKIAEKGKFRPKSSCVIPLSGLAQFIALIDYYMQESAAERDTQPRDMFVEQKVFNFSIGENDRGRFLRVFERGGGFPAGGSSLMIPAGWGNANLKQFRDCLDKVAHMLPEDAAAAAAQAAAEGPVEPLAPHSGASTSREGGGLGGAPLSPPPPRSVPTVPGSEAVLLDSGRDGGPVLSVAGNKHFFFDVRANERGQYLRIKEVSGVMKNLLVVPLHAVPQFQEAVSMALLTTPKQDAPAGEPSGDGSGGRNAAQPPERTSDHSAHHSQQQQPFGSYPPGPPPPRQPQQQQHRAPPSPALPVRFPPPRPQQLQHQQPPPQGLPLGMGLGPQQQQQQQMSYGYLVPAVGHPGAPMLGAQFAGMALGMPPGVGGGYPQGLPTASGGRPPGQGGPPLTYH